VLPVSLAQIQRGNRAAQPARNLQQYACRQVAGAGRRAAQRDRPGEASLPRQCAGNAAKPRPMWCGGWRQEGHSPESAPAHPHRCRGAEALLTEGEVADPELIEAVACFGQSGLQGERVSASSTGATELQDLHIHR
jgi:hypothetical protein